MSVSSRQRAFTFGGPMLVGIIAAQRAAAQVRTVDFVLLFAGGAAFGIGLAELIRFLRAPRS